MVRCCSHQLALTSARARANPRLEPLTELLRRQGVDLGALCRSTACSKQAFALTRFSPPYCFEMINSAAVRRLTLGSCAQ